MTCDELRDDYATYAIGSLDGPELDELRQHLARSCETCTPGVRDALAVVASMATAVKEIDPPQRLRKRVIALVSPEKSGSRMAWLFALSTALALFAAVTVWIRLQDAQAQSVAFEQHYQQLQTENGRLSESLALLEDPAAKEVTFGKGARGRVVLSPRHGVAFSGQNMAALAPGKTYEMWIIPKGGKPVPAGTFAPSPDGSALHLQTGPVDVATTAAVAVSIEKEGGVDSPTADQIIIVAPVGQ
ncbi:MAG TPA: anti-sigma factor [Bryobacteraceae bacterium]|jgi:anti-sigma-K factor RskA